MCCDKPAAWARTFRHCRCAVRVLCFGLAVGVFVSILSWGPRAAAQTIPNPVDGTVPPAGEEVAGLLRRGFDLLALNDAPGAAGVFRQAIDIQPESGRAHRGLGLALWAQRQGESAFRELEVATRLDPTDAEAHFALAQVARTLSVQAEPGAKGASRSAAEYQRLALAEFSKAVALRPLDFEMQMTMAAFCLETGRGDGALAAAQKSLSLAASPAQQARARVMLGRAYMVVDEIDRAEAEFDAALQLAPSSGEAHFGLGQVRLSQGKAIQAEHELRLAIRAVPDWAPAYEVLAGVLLERGQVAEARALLEKAVSLDPGNWQAQYRLAVVLSETGDANRAGELFEDVARRRPDFLPVREQLGLSLLRRGEVQAATAQAEALMAKAPQAAEGHRLMALVLWKQRDFEGALASAAMALNAEPDTAAMLALQAISLWQLTRKKEARSTLVQAAKIQPKVANAEVFCRLLLCGASDIGLVSEFLRKNRWTLQPAAP